MKTYYISIHVDIETGEIFKPKIKNKNYKIIKTTKTYENNGEYTICTSTNECRTYGEQSKLQL